MNLEFSNAAKVDLDEIWDYSRRNWGAVRAAGYLDRLADAAEALARGELTGTRADDIRPGLRRLVSGSHILWFRITDDRLLVIRVLHQSRDAGRWMG